MRWISFPRVPFLIKENKYPSPLKLPLWKGNPPTLQEKETLLTFLHSGGMETGTVTMGNGMEGPWKTKNTATIWAGNPTPGHTARENHNPKRQMYPNSLQHYLQQPGHGSHLNVHHRKMDKEDVVYTYIEWNISHKKECSNMDGSRDCHTEWSQRKTNIWYH